MKSTILVLALIQVARVVQANGCGDGDVNLISEALSNCGFNSVCASYLTTPTVVLETTTTVTPVTDISTTLTSTAVVSETDTTTTSTEVTATSVIITTASPITDTTTTVDEETVTSTTTTTSVDEVSVTQTTTETTTGGYNYFSYTTPSQGMKKRTVTLANPSCTELSSLQAEGHSAEFKSACSCLVSPVTSTSTVTTTASTETSTFTTVVNPVSTAITYATETDTYTTTTTTLSIISNPTTVTDTVTSTTITTLPVTDSVTTTETTTAIATTTTDVAPSFTCDTGTYVPCIATPGTPFYVIAYGSGNPTIDCTWTTTPWDNPYIGEVYLFYVGQTIENAQAYTIDSSNHLIYNGLWASVTKLFGDSAIEFYGTPGNGFFAINCETDAETFEFVCGNTDYNGFEATTFTYSYNGYIYFINLGDGTVAKSNNYPTIYMKSYCAP